MWRKKANLYLRSSDSREIMYPRKIFPATQALASGLERWPPPLEQGTHVSTGNPARVLMPKASVWRVGESTSLRRGLWLLAFANAGLTCIVSVLGYVAVHQERGAMQWIVVVVSVVQVVLVVLHANVFQRWKESVRQELRLSLTPVQPLSECRAALLLCAAESCLHLLVLPPGVSVEWTLYQHHFTLDTCLFVVLLLRYYHLLRLLFWLSELSTRRPALFLKVASIHLSSGFVLKHSLSRRGLTLVLGLFSAVAVVSGTALYAFEGETPYSLTDSV